MDYVHYHCENCNSATPQMYNVRTISNITCIEELRNIINSNLITYFRYDLNCKNCTEIKNWLINIDNYSGFRIYNFKLIEEYGLFLISPDGNYHRLKDMNTWTTMNEEEFFDSIKIGSLLQMNESMIYKIDKIAEKFCKANLVQIVDNFHYYLIEKLTMTKPARKNNSSN